MTERAVQALFFFFWLFTLCTLTRQTPPAQTFTGSLSFTSSCHVRAASVLSALPLTAVAGKALSCPRRAGGQKDGKLTGEQLPTESIFGCGVRPPELRLRRRLRVWGRQKQRATQPGSRSTRSLPAASPRAEIRHRCRANESVSGLRQFWRTVAATIGAMRPLAASLSRCPSAPSSAVADGSKKKEEQGLLSVVGLNCQRGLAAVCALTVGGAEFDSAWMNFPRCIRLTVVIVETGLHLHVEENGDA